MCCHANSNHCGFYAGRRQDTNDSEDEELQRAIRASLRETHMNRPPSLDDYDPGIQSAIRDSLDNAGGEPSRWSNNPRPQRRGPSSGPSPYPPRDTGLYNSPGSGATSRTPPYPSHEENLYPRMPHNPPPYAGREFSQSPPYRTQGEGLYPRVPEPSAPPSEHVNGYPGETLPYPTESRMPDPSNLDEVRRRRIQRFQR